MKLLYSFLFLATVLIQASGQVCTPILDEVSRIGNDYRQRSTYALSSLNFDVTAVDPFYNGDGTSVLFDLGFAKGIWAGGFDPSGNLKVAASGYGSIGFDFVPGPIWTEFQNDEDLCEFFRRAWMINGADITIIRNLYSSGELELGDIPTDILEWPARGNPYIMSLDIEQEMAPYFDNDQDGNYDPLKGDFPIALAENPEFIPFQFRFYVFNDQTDHSESQATPLDMEFHVLDYVVDCPQQTESETSVFTRLKYIHKGLEDLRNFRIGIWDDSDLGCFEDDFVGCRPELNSSYVYNKGGVDRADCTFGQSIPEDYGVVRSLVFLNSELKKFIYYYNCGFVDPPPQQCDPQSPSDYYNFLDGRWRDGESLTIGGTGFNPGSTEFTSHAFTDLPTQSDGWSMEALDLLALDARMLSVFDVPDLMLSGQAHVLDFADHVLISEEKTGIDVFEEYQSRIESVKEDYRTIVEGGYECSLMSSTSDIENIVDCSIHPNPVTDLLELDFNVTQVTGSILIHSIAGVLVGNYESQNSPKAQVPVAHLDSGLYLVTLTTKEGLSFSQRFVKL